MDNERQTCRPEGWLSTEVVHILWNGWLMPVYEYACLGCGERADRIVPHVRADDPGPCPACGGTLSRRFSRVAVRYRGWGFNATDRMVPDRPGGRNDFDAVRERAEKLSDTGEL